MLNFDAATEACSSSDSHLVYIGSSNEEDFLKNNTEATQDYWIGLTVDGAGEPIWLDNSTLTYTHLTDSSFNEGSECFRFASTRNYEWHDRPCSDTYGYICEKEIGKSNYFTEPERIKNVDLKTE